MLGERQCDHHLTESVGIEMARKSVGPSRVRGDMGRQSSRICVSGRELMFSVGEWR